MARVGYSGQPKIKAPGVWDKMANCTNLRLSVDFLLALAATETQDKVEGRLLLDVVVGQGAAVLELLAGEDQTLLVGRDALLVLDLLLHILDRICKSNTRSRTVLWTATISFFCDLPLPPRTQAHAPFCTLIK